MCDVNVLWCVGFRNCNGEVASPWVLCFSSLVSWNVSRVERSGFDKGNLVPCSVVRGERFVGRTSLIVSKSDGLEFLPSLLYFWLIDLLLLQQGRHRMCRTSYFYCSTYILRDVFDTTSFSFELRMKIHVRGDGIYLFGWLAAVSHRTTRKLLSDRIGENTGKSKFGTQRSLCCVPIHRMLPRWQAQNNMDVVSLCRTACALYQGEQYCRSIYSSLQVRHYY